MEHCEVPKQATMSPVAEQSGATSTGEPCSHVSGTTPQSTAAPEALRVGQPHESRHWLSGRAVPHSGLAALRLFHACETTALG